MKREVAHTAIRAAGRSFAFPIFSTRVGRCPHPEAVVGGRRFCRRSRNNILAVGGVPWLDGWRPVGARARWNAFGGVWRRHDVSLQRVGEHRFWGVRHHVRWWVAPDGSYAIGQAHVEDWARWPRRHRVLGIDEGMEAVRASLRGVEHEVVGVEGTPVLVVAGTRA